MSLTKATYSMISGAQANVLDYGADPTGVADSLAAFNNAQATLTRGGTLYVPPGTYKMSDTFEPGEAVYMLGANNGEANFEPFTYAASKLIFSGSTIGIRLNYGWTKIENICVEATAKIGTNSGILMLARSSLENISVKGFSGNGCEIIGFSPTSNSNLWTLTNCRFTENTLNGLYVDGPDSNAGVAIRVDCEQNGGCGIYDSSFLGNTYVGCHTANNIGPQYKTDSNSATNVFLNCYSEFGSPASSLVYPTVVFSGRQDANYTSTSTHAVFGNRFGNAQTNGLDATESVSGVDWLVQLNGNTSNRDILSASRSDIFSGSPWRLKWLDDASARLRFDYGNLYPAFTVQDPDADNVAPVFFNKLQFGSYPPANASDTGVAGTITYNANYIYVCVATNTWKRAALNTW
jgi:hypothetical protein